MTRTSHSFSILQATAAILAFAIILWTLGVPSLRFAEAANVISFSDTLSDSAPSVVSNHTIEFVTPTGIVGGETISIVFPTGFTGIGALDFNDLDLAVNGTDEDLAGTAATTDWGVNASGNIIDIESGTDTIGAGATVTIEIGTNALAGATGDSQITNPATSTSYQLDLLVGADDTGSTRVAIVDAVTVTASVDALFTFTVGAVASGTAVTGSDTTSVLPTATTIPFGQLEALTAKSAAQTLEVSTNAANGFVVTVQADQQLLSANGADIDGFANGNYTSTPGAWSSPTGLPTDEDTFGHWGLSSTDATMDGSDPYSGGTSFVSASTTPVEVFRHDGPADGSTAGQGTAEVIYKVEISALQEAATDYTATLTYVATPVF